jgi:hypothetical protein
MLMEAHRKRRRFVVGRPLVLNMTKCVKPLRHLVRLSAESFRWTNQNAPLDLVLRVAQLHKCPSGFTYLVITPSNRHAEEEEENGMTCRSGARSE